MSVRGWVFVAMLLSVAVVVKPALKVAMPPEPNPVISDDPGSLADDTDQTDVTVADNRYAGSGGGASATPDHVADATPPAMPADRADQRQASAPDQTAMPAPVVPATTGNEVAGGDAPTSTAPASNAPSSGLVIPQSEMADMTRSIMKDYALRRERALLAPNVAATALPGEADEAQRNQQRAAEDARRASDLLIAESEEKLDAERKRTSALADELATVKGQLASAQESAGQLRDAVTSAESQSDIWHRAAEQAQAEAADTKTDLAKVTAEAADTKDALGKARAENVSTAAALASAQSEAASAADRQKELDRAAESRVEELRQQLAAETARAGDLTQEIAAARAQLVDADRQRSADADERRALQSVSRDLDAKLQDEQKKNAALAADLATAQASIRQLQEQAKALQAAAASARASTAPQARKQQERDVPEARLDPAKPNGPSVKRSPSAAIVEPRSQSAKLTDDTAGMGDATRKSPGAGDNGSSAARGTRKPGHGGRSGEVIGYIPESPEHDEGFTSDDYSPYDTSDHTVYVDEYVTSRQAKAMIRRGELHVAKRSVEVR